MTSAPQSASLAANVSGVGAVEAIAVFVDRDLRHHRQLGIHIAGRQHGLMQFLEVAEGFQDQQVDAAFGQRSDLLAKRCAGFLERSLAQRLNANPQRADRAGDPDIEALGGFAGQARARRG